MNNLFTPRNLPAKKQGICEPGGCCIDGVCGCFTRIFWNNSVKQETEHKGKKTSANANQFTEEERLALLQALWGPPTDGETLEADAAKKLQLRTYMTHMALSNTVVPFEDDGVMKFQVESAEELAMADFAKSCGFFKRKNGPIELEITKYDKNIKETGKVVEVYNHVATFGFTSKRARVTVVHHAIKSELWENKVVVMSKGQDTVMLPLIKKVKNENRLLLDLKNCSSDGLRTLLLAQAVCDESFWKGARQDAYQAILESSDDSPAGKEMVHDTFNRWETEAGLEYIGAMGLEDQLQLLVPETIGDLLKAGIKVWMITGDKVETAKNIGIACNLIDPDMQPDFDSSTTIEEAVAEFQNSRLIEVTGQWAEMLSDDEELGKLYDTFDFNGDGVVSNEELKLGLLSLQCQISDLEMEKLFDQPKTVITKADFLIMMRSVKMTLFDAVCSDVDEGLTRYNAITDHNAYPVSTLVNRAAFKVMFPSPGEVSASPTDLEILRSKFFLLASVSKSVVFARAEPAMKKRMVTEIMSRQPEVTTLAIGDGANDTDMITAAHVGVGIAGVEGTAATNSADYAIGTFRMLHTLIFVHGTWNYERNSVMVNFIFFKAIMIAVVAFCFGFISSFSGQQYFEDTTLQFYNVVFTALPIIAVSVLDKRLNRLTLQNNPLISKDVRGKSFSAGIFAWWIFRAVLYGNIVFWFPVFGLTGHAGHAGQPKVNSTVSSTDYYKDQPQEGPSLYWISTLSMFSLVFISSFVCMLEMQSISFLHWLALLSSWSSVLAIHLIVSQFPTSALNGTVIGILTDPNSMLVLLLTIAAPCLFEMGFRGLQRAIRPTLSQILQERVRKERTSYKRQKYAEAGDDERVDGGDGFDLVALTERKLVMLNDTDKDMWDKKIAARHKNRRQSNFGEKLAQIQKKEPAQNATDTGTPSFKTAVIKSMLRFRNLTGSQFESAARSNLQVHDKMQ